MVRSQACGFGPAPCVITSAEFYGAVFDGVIRQVYEIHTWHPAGTTLYETRRPDQMTIAGRWEFAGIVEAALSSKYLNGSVLNYLPKGAQNPIAYVNC